MGTPCSGFCPLTGWLYMSAIYWEISSWEYLFIVRNGVVDWFLIVREISNHQLLVGFGWVFFLWYEMILQKRTKLHKEKTGILWWRHLRKRRFWLVVHQFSWPIGEPWCWYIDLHNWVILFGHVLGFIFQHHGSHMVYNCRCRVSGSSSFRKLLGLLGARM